MSRLNFGKKLLPARTVWKSFTTTLQKKLHKVKRSKLINKTTKRINKAFATIFNRSQPLSPRIRLKKQSLNRPVSTLRIRNHNHSVRRSYAPVYVDELFMGPVMGQVMQTQKVTTKVVEKVKPSASIEGEKVTKRSMGELIESSSSQMKKLEGVDERAEEFIARFKEEMRLQRQKSFGEYQEMLARGV